MPRRELIQGVHTIVLTLVDLTPMQLSSSDARGTNLQQEPSLETMVYKKCLNLYCQVNKENPHKH